MPPPRPSGNAPGARASSPQASLSDEPTITDSSFQWPALAPRRRALAYAAIVVLAVAASASSLGNGFALDDVALVARNQRVHSLDRWWALFAQPYWPPQFGPTLYRPLSLLAFAAEWAVGGGAPLVFHLLSVVLYAAVCALVLAAFLLVLPFEGALIGAVLFAVHPVHVEAVGNVVGQNELVTGVATLAAAVLYLRARSRGTPGLPTTVSIAGLFAVACFTKEHGLLLPVLLLILEAFAPPGRDARPRGDLRTRVREVAPLYLTLAVIGVAYLLVRASVLGDVFGEQDVVPMHGLTRLWTMLVVAPHWVRLLLWPAALSAEYSPQQIVIPDGPGIELVPGVTILLGAAVVFAALGREARTGIREPGAARIGLLWAGITLLPVSNLFSAMILGERTLLLPSVGAMLAVGAGASAALRMMRPHPRSAVLTKVVVGVVSTLVLAGAIRSSARQRVWRDDATLLAQTVKDAPLSYRAQFFYGQLLFEQGNPREGERRLLLAIRLNPSPTDVSPLNYLATQYRDAGMCPQALPLYERAFATAPGRVDVRYGLAACLMSMGRPADARRLAEDGVRRGELRSLFAQLLARLDTASGR